MCSYSVANSRWMWLCWVWMGRIMANNSHSQVNKFKTGQPQPNPSFPLLTCWYSWQTSGWASVLAICSRCGLRRCLEQPPNIAASTMSGAQGCEEELGVVTWSSSSLRKTAGDTKVPSSFAAARHWEGKEGERRGGEGVERRARTTGKPLLIHRYIKDLRNPPNVNRCIPSPWALLGPV